MNTTCAECARLTAESEALSLATYATQDHDEISRLVDEMDELPRRWWHCERCGAHLERYRGEGDVSCSCRASYNAFGQRLRDDWYENRAWRDGDLDDLEGYELACLASEARG